MSEQNICICRREKEIDELKEEVKRLRDFQSNDHDLLVRLDVKLDGMNNVLKTLVDKVEDLNKQPSDRFEKLKMGAIITFVNGVVVYLFNVLVK